MTLARRLQPIWPLLTFAGSAALLAGAHAFERIGGLAPCQLCFEQRNWHWAVVAVSIVAFIAVRMRPAFARWAAIAAGLVLLGAASMAMYHVAVEQHWVIAQCDANLDLSNIRPFDENEGSFTVPRCDEIAWQMFGISMAGYNAIISLMLALASFWVAAASEKKA